MVGREAESGSVDEHLSFRHRVQEHKQPECKRAPQANHWKCKGAPQGKLFRGSTVMIPRERFHSNNLNNPELGENLTFVRATDRLALLGSFIACVEMLQENFVLQK